MQQNLVFYVPRIPPQCSMAKNKIEHVLLMALNRCFKTEMKSSPKTSDKIISFFPHTFTPQMTLSQVIRLIRL